MFENETYDVILQRMLNRLPADIDKREGSVAYDMLSISAVELAMDKMDKDNILRWCFASPNMPSKFLDMRAAEFGLTRKVGVKATGTVFFTGSYAVTIPIGTQVTTGTGKIYETTENITLAYDSFMETYVGSGLFQAVDYGIEYNVGEAEEFDTVLYIDGIDGVYCFGTEGGIDEETDEAFLARFLEAVQNPATSGNAAHYVSWAKEYPGIVNASCIPIWNGPGTVKVVVVADTTITPDATLLNNVTQYIQDRRPVGATVTVIGCAKQTLTITATVTLSLGYTNAMAVTEVTEKINEYLSTLSVGTGFVQYSKVYGALSACVSIDDFSNLKVNNGTANITINADSIPVLGSVTL